MINPELVHMDLDSFFVSCERLQRPDLVGKPIVIGGYGDRSVVSSASYEARVFGVHAAMPMRQALALCPHAVVVRGDMDMYSKKSGEVTEVIAERAPLYEKASIDEHYIDVTGMERFHGSFKWTHELRMRIIKETGLPISFGLSVNKTAAKMATNEAKPNGELYIRQAELKQFLWPLSIKKIPGLGAKTFQLMVPMGIRTVGDLAAMPKEYMLRVFGKLGLSLWEKAHGLDASPIVSFTEQKSMSQEHTFAQDTIDPVLLDNMLISMAEDLGYQLRSQDKLAGVVSVKVRFADFETHTKERRIAYSSADHLLLDHARYLLKSLTQRRQLVRLVGMKVGGLVGGNQQLFLFDDAEQYTHLYLKMDRLKNKFGSSILMRASGIDLKKHEAEQKLPMRHLTEAEPLNMKALRSRYGS